MSTQESLSPYSNLITNDYIVYRLRDEKVHQGVKRSIILDNVDQRLIILLTTRDIETDTDDETHVVIELYTKTNFNLDIDGKVEASYLKIYLEYLKRPPQSEKRSFYNQTGIESTILIAILEGIMKKLNPVKERIKGKSTSSSQQQPTYSSDAILKIMTDITNLIAKVSSLEAKLTEAGNEIGILRDKVYRLESKEREAFHR